ncbi:MAG: helix-turn-helix domain-containing protein [Candidatus Thermoplasmatota archaeon]|nr:helix-turn-helix domain-containing protein [Candidatus Thermoplasmatota archaeon]
MWDELLLEAGLTEREVRSIMILGSRPKLKASELAMELNTTRLDAYNSLSRLQEMGIVTATADRPMLFSSLRINEAMEHIIQSRKQQLDRLVDGFDELSKGITETDASYEKQRRDIDDPRFAVLKERTHIYNRLQKMANDAEERLILLLGQFGILHLCRSPDALEAVNTAAVRGVVVQIITHLDGRTLRFFDKLDKSIDVRHSDELDSLGFVQDQAEVIQYLNIEDNPVGRGKEDAALIIESGPFSQAHLHLIDAIWEGAVPLATARARFTENQINDPLRLTIGEGSFLKNVSVALGFDGQLPEEDTPFDPDAFFAAGNEVNEARMRLTEGKLSNLKVLGIDIGRMLRQIGNRVGQEIAFSLRSIENDIEFLDEMMDWWEHAGLGLLQYDVDPQFHVVVGLNHPPIDDVDALPMWEMDDGIIEGALSTRFAKEANVVIQRIDGNGHKDDLWRYLIHRHELNTIELHD